MGIFDHVAAPPSGRLLPGSGSLRSLALPLLLPRGQSCQGRLSHSLQAVHPYRLPPGPPRNLGNKQDMRQSNPKPGSLELVTVEPWFVRGILNNMLYTFRLLTFINDIVSFDLASWMGEG